MLLLHGDKLKHKRDKEHNSRDTLNDKLTNKIIELGKRIYEQVDDASLWVQGSRIDFRNYLTTTKEFTTVFPRKANLCGSSP